MVRWAKSEKTATRKPTRIEELLDIIFNHEPWMARGACVEIGGEPFYPSTSDADQAMAARAKRICRTKCPVQEKCLAYALRTDQRFGIWGGLGPVQRSRLQDVRQPQRSAAGRVYPKQREEDYDMPICICTAKEKETEAYDPDCPLHRKAPEWSSWSGSDDWS